MVIFQQMGYRLVPEVDRYRRLDFIHRWDSKHPAVPCFYLVLVTGG